MRDAHEQVESSRELSQCLVKPCLHFPLCWGLGFLDVLILLLHFEETYIDLQRQQKHRVGTCGGPRSRRY